MAPAGSPGSEPDTSRGDSRPFVCGVVEGFYGRPWTLVQRKDLFDKMQCWGMGSYLYAPKDDCKHRAFWRELYTVEEADHLQSLITAASDCNVDFYYAISPGLDITYSNSKEVATLKRKLDQVAQLGCKAFALLFDDIEAEMSKPDKEAFQSFAAAQVSVTNEIYQHLGQPKFLFCPTQYCTSRAVPTIATSEYLKTIGAKLAPDIDIMWTGDKVIPRDITVTSLEEITTVLNRPPVIWDNEHANDYDQKRMYLGPYSGRSPDIIPKLRGVMTNPNCEYGANFVAIHSLAAWSHCTVDGCGSLSPHDTVSADIKLELGSPGGSVPDTQLVPPPPNNLPAHVYHPRHALRSAVTDWMGEFVKVKAMWGPITKPQVGLNPSGILQPSVNTCITTTATTSSVNSPLPLSSLSTLSTSPPSPKPDPLPAVNPYAGLSSGGTQVPIVHQGVIPPLATPLVPVMNSLVSHNEVVLERPVNESQDLKSAQPEPMDTMSVVETANCTSPSQAMESTTNPPTPAMVGDMVEGTTNPPTPASVMQVEGCLDGSGLSKAESTTMLCEVEDNPGTLTVEEVELICDLFYLPCEHGPKAIEILTEFYWLKTHAGVMLSDCERVTSTTTAGEEGAEVARPEWIKRKEKFVELVHDVRRAFEKICNAPNRELVYNLYTYLWDMVGVVFMLLSYIDWLSLGRFSPKYQQLIIGRHTWFSGIREAFQSGDHEPWVFRGGLTADLQRLMPVDSGNDLFLYQYPDTPTTQLYSIRPYRESDSEAVHNVALRTWDDGMDASVDYTSHPSLVGEKSVGPFISFYPGLCFVFENNLGDVVGYIFAAPSIHEFHQRVTNVWLPELRCKYPLVEPGEGELLTPCEAMINSIHTDPEQLPAFIDGPDSWAICRLAVLPSVSDASLSRRSTMLLLACLRTSGVLKVLVEVPRKERYMMDLYTKMGFMPLGESPTEPAASETAYLFRRY